MDALTGKTLEELTHPDIWLDGFTAVEIAEITQRAIRDVNEELRLLCIRGLMCVEVPSGRIMKRSGGAGIVATRGEYEHTPSAMSAASHGKLV
ncbi:hypothetical protein [Bradyrhizobium manausense]|nr:hypothetical protein [Bradyrhizobium manausense]